MFVIKARLNQLYITTMKDRQYRLLNSFKESVMRIAWNVSDIPFENVKKVGIKHKENIEAGFKTAFPFNRNQQLLFSYSSGELEYEGERCPFVYDKVLDLVIELFGSLEEASKRVTFYETSDQRLKWYQTLVQYYMSAPINELKEDIKISLRACVVGKPTNSQEALIKRVFMADSSIKENIKSIKTVHYSIMSTVEERVNKLTPEDEEPIIVDD